MQPRKTAAAGGGRERCLLLDANAAARASLIDVLEDLGLWTEVCSTGQDCADRLAPPDGSRIEACPAVALIASIAEAIEAQPALLDLIGDRVFTPPIVLTTTPTLDSLEWRLLQRGVWDLIAKPIEPTDARRALVGAIEEGRRRLADRHTVLDFRRRERQLSDDEHTILVAVCEGKLNKQIARELGVSVRTVEQRRRRVFTKMNVPSAVPLARRLATVNTLERLHVPHAGGPSQLERAPLARGPLPTPHLNAGWLAAGPPSPISG